MMTINVTLQVPSSVYRLAQKTAEVTSRPVEQVLADALTAASPISDNLPPKLQVEIDSLALLSDEELWKIAKKNFPIAKRREYDRLLEKHSAGTLISSERKRLRELRMQSEQLMLRKAHAYSLLKWRGHTLPALSELPHPR